MFGDKPVLIHLRRHIISSILSNYNGIKLEINYRKKQENSQYVIIQQAPEKTMGLRRNQKNKKNTLGQMKLEIQHFKTFVMQQNKF